MKDAGIALRSYASGILVSAFCILAFSAAWAADISLHGFLQGNYSFDAAGSNPDGGDFKDRK
ncbi:MAG: hypothetical protein M1497_06575, partial [Nitrospirae bacterium]|nr:hypothetical protein [Nitrospirota bacterium]